MKIQIGVAILLAILLVYATGCNTDVEENPPTADSTLLKEMISLDTTQTVGLDTMGRTFFVYDAQERLSKIIAAGYALTRTPQVIVEYELQYTGNNPVPRLFIGKHWNNAADYISQPADYKDSLYFFYSNGRIVKDSLLYNTSLTTAITTTYTEAQPNRISIHSYETFRTGAYYADRGTYKVYLTKQGNNITELKDTIPFFGGPMPRKLNLVFDNKVNPFKKIALPYPIYQNAYFDGYVSFILPYYLYNSNDNNILSMESNRNSATPPIIFNYGYDYLNNNLPSRSRTLAVRDYVAIYKYGTR